MNFNVEVNERRGHDGHEIVSTDSRNFGTEFVEQE